MLFGRRFALGGGNGRDASRHALFRAVIFELEHRPGDVLVHVGLIDQHVLLAAELLVQKAPLRDEVHAVFEPGAMCSTRHSSVSPGSAPSM